MNLNNFSLKLKKRLNSYKYLGRKFRPDSHKASKIYLTLMKIINFNEYNLRKSFFKSNNSLSIKIKEESGYLIENYASFENKKSFFSTLKNLRSEFDCIDWEKKKLNSKKPFLITVDKTIDDNVKNLIDKIFPTITNYIGLAPALISVQFWLSPNEETVFGRSQNWHLDGEDYKQIKVFIPMEDICKNSGPLYFVNAKDSNQIYKSLKKEKIIVKRNTKIDDSIIKKYVQKDKFKKMTMKFGDIGFVDTSRCYHYGSRKDLYPRKLLMLQFTSSFCTSLPSIFRKQIKDKKNLKEELLYGQFEETYKKFLYK